MRVRGGCGGIDAVARDAASVDVMGMRDLPVYRTMRGRGIGDD
jgi:hypothetical protein